MNLSERINSAIPFIGECIVHTAGGSFFDCTVVSEYLRREWLEHHAIPYIRLSTGSPTQREVLNDSAEVFYIGHFTDLEKIFCTYVMADPIAEADGDSLYADVQREVA